MAKVKRTLTLFPSKVDTHIPGMVHSGSTNPIEQIQSNLSHKLKQQGNIGKDGL